MQLKRAAMSAFPVMVSLSIMATVSSVSGTAAASALIEQSASGLGNAYAGGAASAEDASTIFFNPAGMSRLSGKQIAVALHAVNPSTKFSDTGSAPAAGRPLGTVPGETGRLVFVPNAYFAMEINPRMKFGLGVNVPFGNKTEYPAGWVGRFQALKSSTATINVNPSLSYRINDAVAIGVGLDYQKIRAKLTSAKSFGGLGEGLSTVSGSDAAWGYNLGALFEMGSGGRIGISYRSSIQYRLSGTMLVTNQAGAAVLNQAVTTDLKMPDTLSLSYFRALGKQWVVMADLSRSGWSSYKELRVIQVSNGAPLLLNPANWSDTWRVALGGSYHYNEKWTARAGVAYDQAGVSDAFRTARIPDADRTWLTLGGQYKSNKDNAVDFGYAHLFVKGVTISNNTGAAGTPAPATVGKLAGNYASSADILSMQYTHGF